MYVGHYKIYLLSANWVIHSAEVNLVRLMGKRFINYNIFIPPGIEDKD